MKPGKKLKINGPIRLMSTFNLMEGEGDDAKRFDMVAYTGAAVEVGFGIPTVFDLSAMSVSKGNLPILLQHDPERRVGFGEAIENSGSSLTIQGQFLENEHAEEVIRDSKQGFPWQASVGLAPKAVEFIDSGNKATINGQVFEGPVLRVSSQLRESSFVSMGADGETSAVALSASAESNQYELEVEMSQVDNAPTADKKGASAKELRAAFPNDSGFVLDCIEAGLTVEEAHVKYLPVIQAKHAAELEAQRVALEAKAVEKQSNPPVIVAGAPGSSASDGETATEKWQKLIQAQMDRGLPRHKAASIVAQRNPQLSKAMVLEANQGRQCYVPNRFRS